MSPSPLSRVERGSSSSSPRESLAAMSSAGQLLPALGSPESNVQFISGLLENNVEFVAVDMPEANSLTVHIMAAMAEHEAKTISARTKAALAAAKKRGVKLGGWRWNVSEVAQRGGQSSAKVRREQALKRASDLPVVGAIQAEGKTSLRQIADELNAREHATPRGKQWTAMQFRLTGDHSACAV